MKVLGFGDSVVDRYVNQNKMFPGGNAVNFAVYAKENGLDAFYLGNFADDAEADHIIASLREKGIGLDRCHRIFGTTTERCDVNLIDGDRVFIGDDLRESKVTPFLLSEKDLAYLKTFDLIHAGCYAGVEEQLEKMSRIGVLKTFDFSEEDEFRTDEYLRQVCPCVDMALFSGENMTEDQIRELMRRAYQLGCSYVLVTRGIHGQMLYDGKGIYTGKVKLVDAVDTMGAGDSFFSCFVCTLLKQGWKKNVKLTAEMVQNAFDAAAEFSARNCLREGGFGFGAPLAE